MKRGEQHIFEVQVCLNDLDPGAVRVELYADGVMGSAAVRQDMTRVRQLAGASGSYRVVWYWIASVFHFSEDEPAHSLTTSSV